MNSFPQTRMRRLRRSAGIRALVEEHRLTVADLIYPLFIHDGSAKQQQIEAMPNVYRYSLPSLPQLYEKISEAGIGAVALFPAIDNSCKDNEGKEAYNDDGLIPRAVRQIKHYCPQLLVKSVRVPDTISSSHLGD